MKNLVLLLLAVDVLFALPNNIQKFSRNEQTLVMVPDAEGRMYLVDLNTYQPPKGLSFMAERDVKFVLTTRRENQRVIERNLKAIETSSFNKSNPTRVTIHGFNGDSLSAVNEQVTAAYLKKGDFNIVMVDWSKGAGGNDYIAARYRVDDVAQVTAEFLDFLHEKKLLSFEDLHIVGHSLGAHISGLIGKRVKTGKVKAIYGLDPAGPLFDLNDPNTRIAETDAEYVEILHTNGFGLGTVQRLGKVDYYPNYGKRQPGCSFTLGCSHKRAPQLFAEGINSQRFVAIRCESTGEIILDRCTNQTPNKAYIMTSEPQNFDQEGIFYFATNAKPPFAKG